MNIFSPLIYDRGWAAINPSPIVLIGAGTPVTGQVRLAIVCERTVDVLTSTSH